jgi:hypothetical protein
LTKPCQHEMVPNGVHCYGRSSQTRGFEVDGQSPTRVLEMAWLISWSSLLMLWAGGPMMLVTCCLFAYCYLCSGAKKKKTITKKQRHRLQLPL